MSGTTALVLITSSFPIHADGREAAGAFVADLVEELAKRIPVRVVAPGTENSQKAWTQNINVFRYATPDRPLSTLRPWHPIGAMQIFQVMRDGAAATERAIQAGPATHLLALWALPCGEWARRSARRHRLPYSVWTLGSDIWSLGRIPLIRNRLRSILRDADSCWSDGIQLSIDTQNIAGRNVELLPSTRQITHTRKGPLRTKPPYRFLFLGRWHPNKGIDILLEALELLTDHDWSQIERITIAGGGPLESAVHESVGLQRQQGRPIELQGFMSSNQAQKAILAADYLLIPSRIESIPVVFSDAIKLQCPVISTPVGDLTRIISGEHKCGILAKGLSPTDFTEALRKAFRTSPCNFLKGINDIRDVFDISGVAEKLLASFEQEDKGRSAISPSMNKPT